MKNNNNFIVGDLYKCKKQIGYGSFGSIYNAINTQTNEEHAVKIEQSSNKQPQLIFEAKLVQYLNSNKQIGEWGFPKIFKYGQEEDYNYMVMELLGNLKISQLILGKSLEDIFQQQKKSFSLKTTLMIAIQGIERLQFLHNMFILHRDLKPDNFLLGNGNKANYIYLIDFGLSKKYITKDQKHIPYRDKKNLTGTARYASINTHLGIEQSRRDDLESFAYILIYFLKGSLPWMNQPGVDQKEKFHNITKVKQSTSEERLCQDLPDVFQKYLRYSKSLQFDEKPDYDRLIQMFKKYMIQNNILFDYKYDWNSVYCSSSESLNINQTNKQQQTQKDRYYLPPIRQYQQFNTLTNHEIQKEQYKNQRLMGLNNKTLHHQQQRHSNNNLLGTKGYYQGQYQHDTSLF